MFLMLITLRSKNLPIKDIFFLRTLHTSEILATMDIVKFASIILILIGLCLIGKVGKHAFDH